MDKPRVRIATDGRVGFREVVRYYTCDGNFHSVPPRDGTRYGIEVLDLREYEEMMASGMLGLGHEYLKKPLRIDNRKTG